MGDKNTQKKRNEIPSEDKWTIDEMYPSESDWEASCENVLTKAEEFEKNYHGKAGGSSKALLDALESSDAIGMELERAYCYAHMKLDENNADPKSQARSDKCIGIAAKVSALTSFLLPEIVSIPEERMNEYIESEPGLKKYEHLLRDAIRSRKHVLTEPEERILANLSEVLSSPGNTFSMLNDADMRFGFVTDDSGEQNELTHASYIKFMRSKDRDVRKEAYTKMYEKYRSLINTMASNYGANVKTDVISARLRDYDSSLSASLFDDDIPLSVYDNLIDSVHASFPALYEYMDIRKKVLGVDELRMYDVYVPLAKVPEKKLSFDEATDLAVKGLSVLGDEYISKFKEGINSGWIDKYENEGKTSGAYSFGSYDSKPYVLMNFDDTIEDLFTLVHEMGHSMNSYYTRKTQPYCYGDHSIFTAEVASTVNETLMMRYLLENETDKEMKKYILNMYIEAFRTTLYRQTMFAEFEKFTHDEVEKGGSLTADSMSMKYNELNNEYFGPSLVEDDCIRYEWARIPHFYNSFYVYQYATGYSAANAIASRLLNEGETARNDYLEFLKCGTNDYPVELLKIAGVDMSEKGPVDEALSTFAKLVKEFGEII